MINITAIIKPLRFTFTKIWTYKDDFERRSLEDDYTDSLVVRWEELIAFFFTRYSQIAIFHIFWVLIPNLRSIFDESQYLASPRPPQVGQHTKKYQKSHKFTLHCRGG